MGVLALPILLRLTGAKERRLLTLAMAAGAIGMFSACAGLSSLGGQDAVLVVENRTRWPVEISEPYSSSRTIPPNGEGQINGWGGPGWINGVLDDAQMRWGPSLEHRIVVGWIAGEELRIVIRNSETAPP